MGSLITSTPPYLAIVAIGVTIALFRVARRPGTWWVWILIGSLASQGILISGYPLADELLVGAVFTALMCAISIRVLAVRSLPLSGADVAYGALIFLFLAASLRSAVVLESPAMLRFVALYALVALIAWGRRRLVSAPIDPVRLRRLTAITSTVYSIAYLVHGMATETFTTLTYIDLQGKHWSGSAYAMFPGIVGAFAALLILRYGETASYRWAIAALATVALAASFYESRVSLLAFAVLLIGAVAGEIAWRVPAPRPPTRQRRLVAIGAVVFLGLVLTTYGSKGGLTGAQLGRVAGAVAAPFEGDGGGDSDRWNHLRAMGRALERNPGIVVFGGGFYSHRLHLVPALNDVLHETGQPADPRAVVRTTGLPALAIDTGVVGVALFYLTLGLAARTAIRKARREARFAVIAFTLVVGGWLLVTNLLDMILLYVLIMPRGMLVSLAEAAPAPVHRPQSEPRDQMEPAAV